MRPTRSSTAAACVLAGALLAPAAASATLPGGNGDILYTVYPAEGGGLRTQTLSVPATGAAAGTPLPGGAGGSSAQVSPDGTKLLYGQWVEYDNGSAAEDLYVSNRDGSAPVNVTNKLGPDSNAEWSTDGSRIVYDDLSGIWLAAPDGSGRTQLRVEQPGENLQQATFTPDGRIVFVSVLGGDGRIKIANADGSGEAFLTEGDAARDTSPSVSPDGTTVYFQRDSSIMKVSIAGGLVSPVLPSSPTAQWSEPFASPNGRKLAAVQRNPPGTQVATVTVANVDGTGAAPVTPSADGLFGIHWAAGPPEAPGGGTPGGGTPGGGAPGGGTPGGGTSGAVVGAAKVGGKGSQRAKGGAGLAIGTTITAPAAGPVAATVTGRIRIKGRKGSIALAKATKAVPAGSSATVAVKLKGAKKARKRAARRIKQGLKQGRKVTATLSVTLAEATGATRKVTRKVTLKR